MKYLGAISDPKDLVNKEYVDGIIPTKVSDLTNDSGFIATETDPTVPSWAKASSKPSYTASEVGAVPTSRKVNGNALSSDIVVYDYFGTCSIAAATAAKTVTVDSSFTLVTGASIAVKFTYTNSVANPTLNVNSTGAKAIMRYGTTSASTSASSSWNAGAIVTFIYDGTYWVMTNWLNTTYSGMTDAEYQAGTSTTTRLITPARLKNAILYWAAPKNKFIFDTYSKSITVGSGASNVTMGTLTQHSGYNLVGYINQNGGFTDQWLISYGTYGSNVVAMVYSKYNGSLTSTISCSAVWVKNS